MSGIMGIGVRSLLANQTALMITSQNMSNVNTPYYCRREIEFADAIFGNGVSISDVRRVFDETASQNLQDKTSDFGKMDVYYQKIAEFEAVLDDESNNIGLHITNSVNALRALNGTPGLSNRNVYLNKLSIMANQFQTVQHKIDTEKQGVNLSLNATTNSVNSITNSIANLNKLITSTPTNERAELLDQREGLKQQLAEYCDFSALEDKSGQLNIYIGNGTLLVNGFQASTLRTAVNPSNNALLDLVVDTGTDSLLVTNALQGGQLAGLFDYYNKGLAESERGLGRLALSIADVMNTQNKLGMDMNRNIGKNIFADINNTALLSERAVANSNNTGIASLTVALTNTSQLTTSEYQLQMGVGNSYILTRLSDNNVVSSGTASPLPATINVDGFALNINSGTLNAGDKYVISPTRNGIASLNMAMTDGSMLGLALPIDVTPNTQSGSDAKITKLIVNDTTNAAFSLPQALNPPITIKFLSPTSYQLINGNDNTVMEGPLTYVAGSDIFPTPSGINPGYQLAISGENLKTDDTFSIIYNTKGSSDIRNGQIMSTLYDKGTVSNGAMNFRQAYDAVANDISVKTNAAKSSYDASQASLELATTRFYQISGVSVEEESINLSRFQQAYTASAQIIETAKSVFEVILGLARR